MSVFFSNEELMVLESVERRRMWKGLLVVVDESPSFRPFFSLWYFPFDLAFDFALSFFVFSVVSFKYFESPSIIDGSTVTLVYLRDLFPRCDSEFL